MRTRLLVVTVLISVLMPLPSALAQYPPIVRGRIETAERKPRVLPNRTVQSDTVGDDVLPLTGADITVFLLAGIALVLIGSVVVRRTRSRATL